MRSAILALAGAPLIGAYRSVRGGHKLNHAVLTALMADRSAWAYVEMPESRPSARPCRPRGRLRGPAYGPGRLLTALNFYALIRADCRP